MKRNIALLLPSIALLVGYTASSPALSQDLTETAGGNENVSETLEEVVVVGRLNSAAQSIMEERKGSETVTDILGIDQISRIGDSDVASALKRVPGVTLVNSKFVYVRGLGERYSSSLLNGASVPSPDLTRNVLPLDIFPASILSSVAVQKGFTPEMPATFGGGNIDIRTKGIPDSLTFALSVGGGTHSDSSTSLKYKGGGDDSLGEDDGTRGSRAPFEDALRTYYGSGVQIDGASVDTASEGSLDISAIEATAARAGNPITREQAAATNAALSLNVYRDLDISERDSSLQDRDIGVTFGNNFLVNDELEAGFLTSIDYDNSLRVDERVQRDFIDPEEEFKETFRTTDSVSITGTANFGLRYLDDHEITSTNMFIRNTDDDVSISNIYNSTSPFSTGSGSRNYDYRYEQRELEVHQLSGKHTLGEDTLDIIGLDNSFLTDWEFTWFYSDSTATTSIPSETNLLASIVRDVETNTITSSSLTQGARMLDVRYTDLEDNVESTGFELSIPIITQNWDIRLSGGGKYDRKARSYNQMDLSVGSSSAAATSTLTGTLSEALSDSNLTNPNYGYQVAYQGGLSRSYIAASMTDAFYGQADFNYQDTWRVAVGARYEEYKQFSSPWQPYVFNRSQLQADFSNPIASELPDGVYYEDNVYPSLAITYNRDDFFAEEFSLRLAVSETVVRPDIREVSDTSYLDPLTDIVVSGNPSAVPADMTNLDLRADWYFENGDSLSISLFTKDIENPLEYFQSPGAEDSVTASIANAGEGETSGVEIEFLKSFEFLGDFGSQFFASGNLTFAESELDLRDLVTAATNRVRPLRGASEEVANIQIGYDSFDGKHAATLAFNHFSERLFTAGIGELPDLYEQPFNALDFSYSYYHSDNFTISLKARNLLDEEVTIKQADVDVYQKSVGQTVSLSVKYDL